MAPPVITALAALVASVLALSGTLAVFFRGKALERRSVNKAILAEIRRLLQVLDEHLGWEGRRNPDFPLIPFSMPVYEEQMKNIGLVDDAVVAPIVSFYGYVAYINALQTLRPMYKDTKAFNAQYERSLRRVIGNFATMFDAAFVKYHVTRVSIGAPRDDPQPKRVGPVDAGPLSELSRSSNVAMDDPNELSPDAWTILEAAETFELLSLDPARRGDQPGAFHGFAVLGKMEIGAPATRREVIAALQQAIAENPGYVAGCFDPHHGLRARREERTADLVISFECAQAWVFVDGVRIEGVLITSSAELLLDQLLTRAGIPLAGKAI